MKSDTNTSASYAELGIYDAKKGGISLRTIGAQGADCPTGRTDSCTDGQSNLLRPFRAKKCCERRYICRSSHKKNKMASDSET